METTAVCWGYIRIKEQKMEITIDTGLLLRNLNYVTIIRKPYLNPQK